MWDAVLFIVGAVLGGVVGWLLAAGRARSTRAAELTDALSRTSAAESTAQELRRQAEAQTAQVQELQSSLDAANQERAVLKTRLEEAAKNLEEQKKLLAEATARLADTFKALSADALRSNNQTFLELARKTLEAQSAEAKGELGKRQQAIEAMIKPLNEALARYEQQIKAMEQTRQKAYGSLEEQLKAIGMTQQLLQQETGNLVNALRAPQVRGQWGEMTLRRSAELAGMVRYCDFDEQVSVEADGGRQRPDMIVHLPAGREIVVDAKAPLSAYLEALEAPDETERSKALARHARHIRDHLNSLSSKAYWDRLDRAPEFVVLFIPGESFFSAALQHDHTLIEDGIEKRVVVATPTTLIALLRAIAYGWHQEQMAENARQISDLARDLHDRIAVFAEHFRKLHDSLERATKSYNSALASLESRVLPGARKFKDLGISTSKQIPQTEPIDLSPRRPELPSTDPRT